MNLLLKYFPTNKKFLFLSVVFFILIASNTILKELQSSVFITIVGVTYVPYAKILSVFIMIPFVLLYSYLVDKLNNFDLLKTVLCFFGITGILFSFLLGFSNIGLYNTTPDVTRFLGWLFYWYIDGFPPFIVSAFWAFTNSLHTTSEAKENYSFLVASSKVGGMVGAAYGYIMTTGYIAKNLSEIEKTQTLTLCAGALLLFAAVTINRYQKNITIIKSYLKPNIIDKKNIKCKTKTDMLEGLKLLIKKPYTLGIFGTIFCFEVINQVLNYQRLLFNSSHSSNINSLNAMLYGQVFFTHFCGFFISIIGTTILLRIFGVKKSLIIMPLLILALISGFTITNSSTALMIAYVGVHVVNYAVGGPLRESLYIITSRDIQYKVKVWLDSVGVRISKITGQQVNIISGTVQKLIGSSFNNYFISVLFSSIIAIWILIAYLLGRKYGECKKENKIIE